MNLLAPAGKAVELATNGMRLTWHNVFMVFLALTGLVFLSWFCWWRLTKSRDPLRLVFKWLLTLALAIFHYLVALPALEKGGGDTVFGLLATVILLVLINVIWRDSLLEWIGDFFGSLYDGGREPPEPKPQYSVARAKRSAGYPLEAIVALREQLAQYPLDYEGALLLATIQVEDLSDLSGAENTLNHFCRQSKVPARQVVAAWLQLADWHLHKGADVDAARAVWGKIVARFPNTEFSLRAEQRLAQLAATEKIILAQYDAAVEEMPAAAASLEELPEVSPGRQAAVYVQHLKAYPADAAVREKLAVIYARDFKRLDLATMELERLLAEPKHSSKQKAAWLNRLAELQVELGADVDRVMATLQKVLDAFPGTVAADLAERRLAKIHEELQAGTKRPAGRA